jgi:cytoskeletal protein CcmA (bactofilin family)
LLSSSVVLGDILSHRVQIEDRAIFHGHCISIKNDEVYQSEKNNYLESKAIKEKVALS